MKIAVASDHAGLRYKNLVKEHLMAQDHQVIDFGTYSSEPSDYPDFVIPAVRAVQDGTVERAVLFGGSGNGEAIAANRFEGIRCCVCWNVKSAELARLHNDSNAISIGERLVPEEELIPIVDTWLKTPFEGGRHSTRLVKLETLSE